MVLVLVLVLVAVAVAVVVSVVVGCRRSSLSLLVIVGFFISDRARVRTS